jgi:ABC-2 type transport system ATP-binding protein
VNVVVRESAAVSVRNMTKTYGRRVVVADVSFEAGAGRVTALLGPNGAGKSTTLRAMLGLVRPTSGTALFDGLPFAEIERPGRIVGVLLDASAGHGGRTVYETARLAALAIGVSSHRVDTCLGLVGLSSVGDRRVGSLSLGMRQRLGLAVALLGEPTTLILDEPGNGLDPEGLRWLNDFVVAFARGGGGVLLSSHHLGDIETIADDVVILDRGRVVHAGPARAAGLTNVAFASTDDDRLVRALVDDEVTVGRGRDATTRLTADHVGRLSVTLGIPLTHLSESRQSLESFFLDQTSGEHAARPSTAQGLLRGTSPLVPVHAPTATSTPKATS